MALWPNNRTDILGRFPVGISGYLAFQEVDQRAQRRLAYFAGTNIATTSSIPEGSFQGAACILPPIVSGGMSAQADFDVTGDASLLSGGAIVGAATFDMVGTGALGLQVALTGGTTITLAQSGALALTISLSGNGTATVTQAGGLSLVVPFSGLAEFALTGSADLKGELSLSGDITPFTELSPQNLAAAVWGRIIESGYTAEQMLRILTAYAAGAATGLEGANPQFTGIDGTTTRIDGTYSAGTRTVNALNGD